MPTLGVQMHDLCRKLFPICRSITGQGFRDSLALLQQHIPALKIMSVATGTQCFDWTIPQEWNIRAAYIITPSGQKICDFNRSNLHVMGYSTPINKTVSLQELQQHLYSLPNQPTAIPYVTSYYKERWGFCLTQQQRDTLIEGDYHIVIDSELTHGVLNYGEIIIPGESSKEIFLSSYLCHPSMANNELSGPVVTTFLVKWLLSLPTRRYSYRIVIVPETIGSIVYLSRNLSTMKKNIVAGFNITCIGDNQNYSYLSSRQEDTQADQAALHVLQHLQPEFKRYSYLKRGSDERQYCAPGVDLPVCSVMRTKYGEYPEYHTSLDNLTFVTPSGLAGGFTIVQECIRLLEKNYTYQVTVLCEPQLGKRGLYPTISDMSQDYTDIETMMNFIAYCDGSHTLLEIANKIQCYAGDLLHLANKLLAEKLIRITDQS